MEDTPLFFPLSFLVLFVAGLQPTLQAQDDSVATTEVPAIATRIPPSSPQAVPASPVNYDFAGNEGEKICLVLTPATTAVIRACSSDASLQFSTNLSPSVPIDLVQTRDAGTMCQLLIITTGSDNLQEDEFKVYYNGSSVRIIYGPLGLSNPNGGHLLPFSASNSEVHLLYRPPDMTRVSFRVCRNGSVADFSVNLPPPTDCRLGTGAGGFSFHFDVSVSDIGQNPLSGQNFTITSGSCDNPEAGVAFSFTVPAAIGSTLPSLSPQSTSAIASTTDSSLMDQYSEYTTLPPLSSSTPTPGHSINTVIVSVVAGVVLLVIVLVVVLVLLCRWKKTKQYDFESSIADYETDSLEKIDYSNEQSNGDSKPVSRKEFKTYTDTTDNKIELMDQKITNVINDLKTGNCCNKEHTRRNCDDQLSSQLEEQQDHADEDYGGQC